MPTLLEQPVAVTRMLVTTPEQARAVEDPARAKILELLYRQDMTADQLAEDLRKAGHNKALTTVRHHIRVLRGAGLVQVTRIDEVRGTISKRYGTQIRLLNYETPEDFESKYAKIIGTTSARMDKILRNIRTSLPAPKGDKQPESYYHYLAVEILNRAVTASLETNRD